MSRETLGASDCIPRRAQPIRAKPRPDTWTGLLPCLEVSRLNRYATAAMAVDIVKMLGLAPTTASTIRTWADRGAVRKGGLDQYGLMRYNLDDIVKVANERQREPAAS